MTTDPKTSVETPSAPSDSGSIRKTAALAGPPPQGQLQLWLHRTSVFLFVLISAVAGVLLVILPWTSEWTDNSLLISYPWVHMVVSSGFFRGLCSGLGLLDIWIGFWEALHYHDQQ